MARTIGQYVATDSGGVARVLWGQEWGQSCGPACCYMVVCSASQSTGAGGEAFMRSLAVKHGATLFDMIAGAGTYVSQLADILEDNGLKVNSAQYAVGEWKAKIAAASERKPIIFHVQWAARDAKSQWVGNGGHFVVCVGLSRGGAVILDPWYGLLEMPLDALPVYNTNMQSVDLNKAQTAGYLSGWLVQVL
ncbi:cysteine peptidase family C39 domain-containing protein [Belnapia moabensis]|uniref:papain-like cysteine protease family protein n=1 Tax=Belnapia moabensis TaxID=365533 RepID=UPI0005B7EDFC|nr:papain-like cysteine protease family protein [Belnapia moabensis]